MLLHFYPLKFFKITKKLYFELKINPFKYLKVLLIKRNMLNAYDSFFKNFLSAISIDKKMLKDFMQEHCLRNY